MHFSRVSFFPARIISLFLILVLGGREGSTKYDCSLRCLQKDLQIPHYFSHEPLFPICFAKNDCISDHVPRNNSNNSSWKATWRIYLNQMGHALLQARPESKNTGLASPRPALGERRATGPPISFPCPSQACQRRAKPKKIRPAVAFRPAERRTVW